MNRIKPWVKASRLTSQGYIFFSLLAGETFYLMAGGTINWAAFTIVHLYGLFMQLYIVYANDCADFETDKINRTYTIFSGGSRVLVDGEISQRALGIAASIVALLSLLMGVLLAVFFEATWAPALILAGIALLWMYSFAPVKLSYRGGGEFLQMLGVGVILPLIGFHAHGGALNAFPLESFAVILPTQLACAMATSIPDYRSDKQSTKRTSTVLLGPKMVSLGIIVLNLFAIGVFFALGWANPQELKFAAPLILLAVIAISLSFFVPRMHQARAVFFFVMLSIVITVGLMGQLAYVASNMAAPMM